MLLIKIEEYYVQLRVNLGTWNSKVYLFWTSIKCRGPGELLWPDIPSLFLFIFFLNINSLEFPIGSWPTFWPFWIIVDFICSSCQKRYFKFRFCEPQCSILPQAEILKIHVYYSLFVITCLSKMIKICLLFCFILFPNKSNLRVHLCFASSLIFHCQYTVMWSFE